MMTIPSITAGEGTSEGDGIRTFRVVQYWVAGCEGLKSRNWKEA
jgi:hypothetical protein